MLARNEMHIDLPNYLNYRETPQSKQLVEIICKAAKRKDENALRALLLSRSRDIGPEPDVVDLAVAAAIYTLAIEHDKESVYLLIDKFGGDSRDAAYCYAYHGSVELLEELQWHYRQSSQFIDSKIVALGYVCGNRHHLVHLLLAEKPHLTEAVVAIYKMNNDPERAQALLDAVEVKHAVDILNRVSKTPVNTLQAGHFRLFYESLNVKDAQPGPVQSINGDVCAALHEAEERFRKSFQ